MRKILLFFVLLACAPSLKAQLNLQLHYDYGHLNGNLRNRPSMTSTIEYFGVDRWGANYFFADIDYYHDGVAGAYWEISKEVNLKKDSRFAAHVEYNGGATIDQLYKVGSRFQHNLLAGLAWNWANAGFTRTLSLQALYKYYFKGADGLKAFNSFQLTAVWGMEFLDHKLTFSGFADLWYDRHIKNMVFVSEPQLWFNVYSLKGCKDIKLSVGGELRVSNNFVYPVEGTNNRFYAIPTTAVKWTF